MFKINKKIEYAVISLNHMLSKNSDGLTTTKEICGTYELPFDPTARVLQIMTQKGILTAEQGTKGGYKIKKDLGKVSLKELSNMLIGPIEVTNCQSGIKHKCSRTGKCKVSKQFKKLNIRINAFFQCIKLKELLKT